MAHSLNQHRDILAVLSKAKTPLRKAILEKLDRAEVLKIGEVCHNILRGAIPLSPTHKAKLARHKTVIRRLAQRGEGWKRKKVRLCQTGNGIFIPILLSALGSVIASALSK